MTQYARPDQDDTDGNWTDQDDGSSLYEAIDEASADDATTYIQITDEWYGDEACIVRLSDVSAPATAGTYIKYKAKASDDSGMMSGPPGLKLELLQDGVVKATVTNSSVSTDWTDYSYTVTDVSGISDWTDLKLRITMITNAGMSDYMYVTQAYLETQDAASGGPIWHVSASGSGSSPYSDWSTAATDIADVDALAEAGDTIYVASGYSSAYSTSTTLDFSNGTLLEPIKIISVDSSTGSPTDGDDSDYLAGATIGASSGDLRIDGNIRAWGIDITITGTSANLYLQHSASGDSPSVIVQKWYQSEMTSISDFIIAYSCNRSKFYFDSCSFIRNYSSAEGFQMATSGQGNSMFLKNCTFTKTSGEDRLISSVGKNGTIVEFEGCDVSDFGGILNTEPEGQSRVLLRGCEVNSSLSLVGGTMDDASVVMLEACSNGNIPTPELGVTEIETSFGTIKSSLSNYRTDGADDGEQTNAHSWEMASSSSVKEFVNPLVSPPMVVWNDGSASIPDTSASETFDSGDEVDSRYNWTTGPNDPGRVGRHMNAVFSCTVNIPTGVDPEGCIFEMGNSSKGGYIGFNGSYDLVIRAGNGSSTLTGTDIARTTVAFADLPSDVDFELMWEFSQNPVGRVRVWIDGKLMGIGTTSDGSAFAGDTWSSTAHGQYNGYYDGIILGESGSYSATVTTSGVLLQSSLSYWHDELAGASKNFKVFIASSTTLQDDEAWVELIGPAERTSTSTRYVERSNDTTAGSVPMNPTDTPSNLTTDSSSTWTGSNVGTKQEISIAYVPGISGPVTMRVCLAKASTTIYVDPKIDVS